MNKFAQIMLKFEVRCEFMQHVGHVQYGVLFHAIHYQIVPSISVTNLIVVW